MAANKKGVRHKDKLNVIVPLYLDSLKLYPSDMYEDCLTQERYRHITEKYQFMYQTDDVPSKSTVRRVMKRFYNNEALFKPKPKGNRS